MPNEAASAKGAAPRGKALGHEKQAAKPLKRVPPGQAKRVGKPVPPGQAKRVEEPAAVKPPKPAKKEKAAE